MTRRHRRVPLSAQSTRPAHAPGAWTLPATAQLLVEGGDARIVLDAARAINQYGCPALPDPELLAFGSSTASVISARGFAAADRLRERLQQALVSDSAAMVYARELERVRQELRALCGIADLPGLDIVFATSGTDLHLIAAQLVAGGTAAPRQPALVVMMEAADTGSQVPAALRGNHFGVCAETLGEPGSEGALIGEAGPLEIASVAVRCEDGRPRPGGEVDAEVESLVSRAAAQGRRVLLILVDVAKTGLLAPSLACAASLSQRFPRNVDVMVDACQFRIAAATLRGYLEQGFMVAVTGSKFMTGPTFSGALLLPGVLAAKLRSSPFPAALWAYSTRAEWPAGWDVAALADYANFGLLLRWEAALAELRDFCALPEAEVAQILDAFGQAVRRRLHDDPLLDAVLVPPLERGPPFAAEGWDCRQTIFPFLLRRPGGHYLSAAETARVHQLLQQPGVDGVRCQLGQPVSCGQRDGKAVSALRLCAGARLVVEAARDRQALDALIGRALLALDKVVALVKEVPAA